MAVHRVLVYLNLLDNHQTADQNALVTANVLTIWLVSVKNARILVLEFVAKMLNAE